MLYGFGNTPMSSTPAGMAGSGNYITGYGTTSGEAFVFTNDQGERVVQTGGYLVSSDGTLHVAYEGDPDAYIGKLIEKQKKGYPLTEEEQELIRQYYAKNPTRGLASLDQLGGSHNGGIRTAVGTPDKNTKVNVQQGGNVWAQNVPGEFARLNS